MKKIIKLSIAICLLGMNLFSQEATNKVDLSIGSDFMSRYVWRGADYGGSPSIQPGMEFSAGSLTFGALGAYTTNSPGVQEADLYVSYSIADMISVTVTDYFYPNDTSANMYFDWSNTTGHIMEGSVEFSGHESLPVSFLFGYNFYGDSENSLYLEAEYSFSLFDVFIGAGNGFYTVENNGDDDTFGIVNIGISVSKDIKIKHKFYCYEKRKNFRKINYLFSRSWYNTNCYNRIILFL